MTGSYLGTPFQSCRAVEPNRQIDDLELIFVCLYFNVLFFLPPASLLSDISNYPESTTANSDVMSESVVETNDPILVNEKEDSGTVPEMDDKLCLRMKLVSPEAEASEESLQFSLESKFMLILGN